MTSAVPPDAPPPTPGSQPSTVGAAAARQGRAGGHGSTPAAPTARPAVADAPRLAAGVQADARPIGPSGDPVGPPTPVRLFVAGLATTEGSAAAADAARLGQKHAGVAGQPSGQITGGALAAEVVGRDGAGRPLLQAAGLRLRLEAALDLPAGARLQLASPQGLAWPPSGGVTPAPGDGPWRRLIEALLLRPAAARDAPGSDRLRLPAPDHALAARLLRWVQAHGASATAAEGETNDPLARDSEPGAALRSALTDLARQAREPQADGWRVLLMALGGEDPIPLKLYLRDPPVDPERHPRSSCDRQVSTRRAIFEVELSRLGRCQLDVLCQATRFDLVVRSAEPLGAGLQDDIRSLVRAASELAGWAGVVEFRVAELLPLAEARAAAGQQITA